MADLLDSGERRVTVYSARHAGRKYCCNTEGSDHYKEGGVEPADLMIAKGIIEDFCIGNMVKYATRFKLTRNLNDLKKVSDYSHILCGVELEKRGKPASDTTASGKPAFPWADFAAGKIAVHCDTEDKAKEFVAMVKEKYPEACVSWTGDKTYWSDYETNTTYSICEGYFCYDHVYSEIEDGCTIIDYPFADEAAEKAEKEEKK